MKMRVKHKKRSLVLGLCVVLVFLGAQGIHATTGRIDEFRKEFLKEPMPVFPRYVTNVTYSDLLSLPDPDEFYSWAKDNEVWTAELLSTLRASGKQAEEIERWVGDPILIAIIDFETEQVYTATFSTETGEVTPEYLDTKTEVWVSLSFLQELIVFADANTVEDTIDFAVDRYYEDWGIWSEQGFWDLLLTREVVATLAVWGGIVGAGAFVYKKKKAK